jgi:hypothetical protein
MPAVLLLGLSLKESAMRTRLFVCLSALFLLAAWCHAADAPLQLLTAHGTVDKVARDTLTIRPRNAEGRFEKTLTLRLTGTSRVSTVTVQKRAGKDTFVQKDTSPRDLEPGQAVAVVYVTGANGTVLLTAVTVPAAEK